MARGSDEFEHDGQRGLNVMTAWASSLHDH